MKSFLIRITFIAAIFAVTSFASAKDFFVPAGSWEKLEGGISVALAIRGHSIVVHIRNGTETAKQLAPQDPGGVPVKLFYVDEFGTPIALGSGMAAAVAPVVIPPGKEMHEQAFITFSELNQIKAHPVTCIFNIYDPATKNAARMQTTPSMLREEPVK